MILVLLRRERDWENAHWNDFYLWSEETSISPSPEQAFRDAVTNFLQTDAGQKAIEDTFKDFNWGDAMTHVPEEIFNLYGLKVFLPGIETSISDIVELVVNQDETLIP